MTENENNADELLELLKKLKTITNESSEDESDNSSKYNVSAERLSINSEIKGKIIPEIKEELRRSIVTQKEWSKLYDMEDIKATAVSVLKDLEKEGEM